MTKNALRLVQRIARVSLPTEIDSEEVAAIQDLLDERAGFLAALEAVISRLDYLRNLWGDEGVTRSLCDQVRAAVAAAKGGS